MEGLTFTMILLIASRGLSASRCDMATTAQVQEGVLGQSPVFNWLGVLTVHYHEGKKELMGLSGIVLIKRQYALVNADDVAHVPTHTLKTNSKAMFLTAQDTPLYVPVQSCVKHPEYEFSSLNTIAIIELDLSEVDNYPLNPICLPTSETFNASRYLFLTGYIDENQKLEKVIYKIQYLQKSVCEEFYNRAGLSSQQRTPFSYVCGYAPSNVSHCVWDNGMALVSNVTGFFYLIGFGVRGPGCAAPARFIDLFPYFQWIQVNTDPYQFYDYDEALEYRRLGRAHRRNGVGYNESAGHSIDIKKKNLRRQTIEPDNYNKTTRIFS